MLALCLHKHKNEHIAPIMFSPFSLDPIGFSVVEPMGTFFAPFHFTFLRARFASVFAKASTRQAAQSRKRVPSFFALASLPSSPKLRRDKPLSPHPFGAGPRFLISHFGGLLHF